MNVGIGAEAAPFPEKEYINGIAVAVYNFTINRFLCALSSKIGAGRNFNTVIFGHEILI
jgi:hypothetical protein